MASLTMGKAGNVGNSHTLTAQSVIDSAAGVINVGSGSSAPAGDYNLNGVVDGADCVVSTIPAHTAAMGRLQHLAFEFRDGRRADAPLRRQPAPSLWIRSTSTTAA